MPGALSYLYLMSETTWGTSPGTNRVFMPCYEYGVQFQPESRQGKPFLGLFQRKHSKRWRGMPAGQLVAPLAGYQFGVDYDVGGTTVAAGSSISLAEYLMDWGICDEAGTIHEAVNLPSKSAEWRESDGTTDTSMIQTGLRVNQATISGDENSGGVQIALDLMGKTDADLASPAAVPADQEKVVEFEFADVVFRIDDGAGGSLTTIPIAGFSLQCQHALLVKYNNSTTPTLIRKMDRNATLSVTLDKNASTYDVVRRTFTETDYVGRLVLQGLSNGTGGDTWTIGTLNFPCMRYVNHQDTRGRDAIYQQPLQFQLLKPDTSGKDMTIAWTEASTKSAGS